MNNADKATSTLLHDEKTEQKNSKSEFVEKKTGPKRDNKHCAQLWSKTKAAGRKSKEYEVEGLDLLKAKDNELAKKSGQWLFFLPLLFKGYFPFASCLSMTRRRITLK